jgi:D-3-phosphoglycerate dehydrogenase
MLGSSPAWTILVTSRLFGTTAVEELEPLRSPAFLLVDHPKKGAPLTEADLVPAVGDAHAIVCGDDQVTAAVMAHAPQLKLIAKMGVGVDRIDLREAAHRGIMVTNVPGANAVAVAELTIGLMIALLRKVVWSHHQVLDGRFPTTMGRELSSMTIGLVGIGHVGREVARRLRAFGATLLAYDPYAVASPDVTLVESLTALVSRADIISLHAPSTPETKDMFTHAVFERMKPGALLINVARGDLVDSAALQRALDTGRLGGAALDVYAVEPPPEAFRIRAENVILTPHIGGFTREALSRVTRGVVDAILAAHAGQTPAHLVRPPSAAPSAAPSAPSDRGR